jgi:hypothetical protein
MSIYYAAAGLFLTFIISCGPYYRGSTDDERCLEEEMKPAHGSNRGLNLFFKRVFFLFLMAPSLSFKHN